MQIILRERERERERERDSVLSLLLQLFLHMHSLFGLRAPWSERDIKVIARKKLFDVDGEIDDLLRPRPPTRSRPDQVQV